MATTTDIFFAMPLTKINNAESLRFHKRENTVIEEAHIPELAPIMPQYRQAIEEVDLSIARLSRENLTKTIEAIEEERDKAVAGVLYQIKSYTYNWQADKLNAADRLMNVYDTYQKDVRSNYQKKSEAIDNMLQHVCDTTGSIDQNGTGGGTPAGGGMMNSLPYGADVQTLEMQPWFDHLKEVNDYFKALYEERELERSRLLNMREVKKTRQKADHIFRHIQNQIAFLILVNGPAQYESLVSQMNVIIKEWNDILARRQAAAKKRKEKENNNNNTNTSANGNNTGNNNTNPPATGDNNTGEQNGENGSQEGSDPNAGEDNTPSANA